MTKKKQVDWRKVTFTVVAALVILSMVVVELLTMIAPPVR